MQNRWKNQSVLVVLACGFKKFTTVNEEKLVIYQKRFNLNIKQCYLIAWGVEEIQKVKTQELYK